ncbi:sugar phosphate nucleotidyltransferase [Cystobacter fuscus]
MRRLHVVGGDGCGCSGWHGSAPGQLEVSAATGIEIHPGQGVGNGALRGFHSPRGTGCCLLPCITGPRAPTRWERSIVHGSLASGVTCRRAWRADGPPGTGPAQAAGPLGGQCHLIDFSLSNCRDSGIDEVLLLSQHNEAQLIHYLLERWHGQGLKIHFGPYQGITPETCEHVLATVHRPAESGTGEALLFNAPYIFGKDVRDVLVLHADHVYRFDYRPMLALHRERRAALTIGYQRIAREAVSLFGMVEFGPGDRLLRFVEKPAHPTSDTVFTAVAIFSAEPLQRYLDVLSRGPWRADVSRDVIPAMIQAGERIFGYRFDGYWEDIGTTARYLEAHHRLVSRPPTLSRRSCRTRSGRRPPAAGCPRPGVFATHSPGRTCGVRAGPSARCYFRASSSAHARWCATASCCPGRASSGTAASRGASCSMASTSTMPTS